MYFITHRSRRKITFLISLRTSENCGILLRYCLGSYVIKNVSNLTSDDSHVAMVIRKAVVSYHTFSLAALFLVLFFQNKESYILQLRMHFNTFELFGNGSPFICRREKFVSFAYFYSVDFYTRNVSKTRVILSYVHGNNTLPITLQILR